MRLSRTQLFDRIHKAGVISMLALTGFGAYLLTVRTYRYFNDVRPMQAERKRLMAEEMIAQEQIEKEAELMRRQQDAEKLVS
ncbi:hypothetical protein V1264_008030 [Littorina saxatilis]|uniref:Cytochrome c oxidase assembly protein n=1 Tax=Littorina saxatilis TaxID=31220 RepID=A0AAN9AS88_9CAEN